MAKEERRRSKDDAWVDILVVSHSRHTGNQDAGVRHPGGPRSRNASRQDPEVVSQEVAQVFAGIRGTSPPFDGDSVDIVPMSQISKSAAMAIFADYWQIGSYMSGLSLCLKTILNIKSSADPTTRVMTLQGLSELLSISTEDRSCQFLCAGFQWRWIHGPDCVGETDGKVAYYSHTM